jgi:hypothetical protein
LLIFLGSYLEDCVIQPVRSTPMIIVALVAVLNEHADQLVASQRGAKRFEYS